MFNVSKFTWFLFGVRPLPFFPFVIYSLFLRHFRLNLILSLACSVGTIRVLVPLVRAYVFVDYKLVMMDRCPSVIVSYRSSTGAT